ncbi:MAG: DHH family phosphoesterase [Patescibacteria group bacterium]
MEIYSKHLAEAIDLINGAKRILLVSHKRPDGDTLGASLALHFGLTQMGKKTVLACIDDIPQRLRFLPKSEEFVREFNLSQFDLIIISDAGAYHMTGFHEKYPEFLSKQIPIINIDHHASNEGFGTVNIVDASASSASVLVWQVLKALNTKLTKEIGICLLAGIYNDTGGFMHANTSKETFEVAHELVQAGINISNIVKPMFKQSSFSQLRLWGYILENVRKNEDKVLSAVVSESEFKILGAHQSDTGGIIDLLNTVPGTSYSVLIAEDNGFVKGSLRTQRDDVNLSDVAGQFGGGGHAKAAGFRVHGKLEKKVVWRIVSAEETQGHAEK